jgi:hypothetical protein
MMKQPLEWIESEGGPLLFAPSSIVHDWHGSEPSTSGGLTDYQRACAVSDEIDVLRIGAGEALVLGDEPDRSALIARSPSSVLIVRWRWARSEESLLSALNLEKIDRLPSGNEKVFRALADQYLLFDSACSGAEIVNALRAELKAGPCSFDTLDFRPNAGTCVLIHRLRVKE